MSCFIVDAEHINVLVEAATGPLTYGHGAIGLSAFGLGRLTRENRNTLGQILLNVNVGSVNERYSENDLYAYTYVPPKHRWEPVAILKAIDCYEYQACEAPNWDTSLAKEFCDKLRQLCIPALPGYQDSPWAIGSDTMPHHMN